MDLSGVRVLDLTRLLPGPYGTQLLADMGADVVKIEPPETGDYAREMEPFVDGIGAVFASVNCGKRSVTLNLKTDRGREVFLELVEDADVVFEQFRPGVVDRLGIGYDEVSRRNEDVVYCSLTGYGQTGPYRDRVGHDLNYVGYAGLLDMTRRSDTERPRIPGFPIADMAGGLFAVFSVLGALLSRELGNGGEFVDVSMTDVVLSLSQTVAPEAFVGDDPRPGETVLTGKYPSYDVYETADGRHVALAALEPRFWENFCSAVGREDLRSYHQESDPEAVEFLRSELTDLFAERTQREWMDALADREAMLSPVKTPAEAIDDPQVRARGIVLEDVPRIGVPMLADSLPESSGHVPDLGEHTESVLRSHGIDDFESLRENGVV